MDEFDETKAIVEQFLCLKLSEDNATKKLTSDSIKYKDQYQRRVPSNLTAFHCAKKLSSLPNDSMANEPKCMELKFSTDQGLSKVSLYIHRKQFQHFLHSVGDSKDWNLIVKVLNDLAEVAIDHMAIYGIDVIDDFVLTATDLIMNCPAQDGDSMYSSIRYIGGWEKFTTNLTKIGCCSIEAKPWGTISSDFGVCLVCQTFWCRKDKTCHAAFSAYRQIHEHCRSFMHKTPINFVKHCGRCGVEKDLTGSLFNHCKNCSSYFCTAPNCTTTFNSLEWAKDLQRHYRRSHNRLISHDNFSLPISASESRNCCSADKKPPTKFLNDWGECDFCGRIWCRISKSCDKSYFIGGSFRTHRMAKHDNPTDFTVECSNCGLKKIRTEGLYRKCQCIKYHCNVEGCGTEYVQTTKLDQRFRIHYASCHPGLRH